MQFSILRLMSLQFLTLLAVLSCNSILAEQTNQQPLRIAGLDWYEDLKDAQLIADGRNGPADDKPIMCFRVLGDMEGFMFKLDFTGRCG